MSRGDPAGDREGAEVFGIGVEEMRRGQPQNGLSAGAQNGHVPDAPEPPI